LNKFLVAIQDVVALNDQQTRAIIEGDPDFARFDLLMGMATRQKNAAKSAWLKHIEAHGC
jgi:hypothetical protein